MTITQLTIEDVRCFANCQRFDIRPLTFLVGENSTGKTTALACFSVLSNFLKSGVVDFNSQPYSMGIFREIVRRSRPMGETFALGFTLKDRKENLKFTVQFCEKESGIEPAVKSVAVTFRDGEIVFESRDDIEFGMEYGSYDEQRNEHRIHVSRNYWGVGSVFSLLSVLSVPIGEDNPKERELLANFLGRKGEKEKAFPRWSIMDSISTFSTAPVRSRPKRTYDATREFDDPEGSDVPMRLMRIEATRKDEWESLQKQLVSFGRNSGLFQGINIKNHGRSLGSPFQLNVKVRGPNSNIADVGYGVSQVLPILVHVLSKFASRRGVFGRSETSFYLLQQPEVHLHPKAQAELTSLLAQLANKGRQAFILETHSDNMIDRARIEVMKGNIKKEDVSLIYLEPKQKVVQVHNIAFDDMGNLTGAPPHYRDFFLHEASRLMGFED